jgi:putative spermidine/putrescine transport system substrate-binding protein
MHSMRFVLMLTTLLASFAVSAQTRTLYVGGPGGSQQKAYEEKIIPEFEARTGAKVIYVPGSSSDTVAKVIAQKGRQDLSLILGDSGPLARAVEQDVCTPLPALPVLNDVYPNARLPGGVAVGYGFYATGLAYNKAVFAKNGWPAPTSWNDLGDPKFKGKVVVGSTVGYGIEALVMLAKANGGSEKNIEPGFIFMSKKVAPNALNWESSQANIAQQLQGGEAALVAWSNMRTQAVMDQGAPVAFVYPKEGARLGLSATCIVKGAPQALLAQQFLETLLSPATQVELAKAATMGPVNSKVKLDAEIARKVVYGPEQTSALVAVDWATVNKQVPDWTKRWNREVER